MIEVLLCMSMICCSIIGYTVCWLLKREIVSLQEALAEERSTVSRQMIELAEVKADKIRESEHFSAFQKDIDEIEKQLDQFKKDYDYMRNGLWDECEISSELRHSRAVIIDHCRKLKRSIGHDRFAHKIEIDAARDKVAELTKERDHSRKLMDETRERCGAEIDVLESTIRDLGNYKTLAENRAKQIISENEYWCTVNDNLRQSRQKIIDHCRMLKRKQKKLIEFYDYVLEELTAIHTYR